MTRLDNSFLWSVWVGAIRAVGADSITEPRGIGASLGTEDDVCFLVIDLSSPRVKESIGGLIVDPDPRVVSKRETAYVEVCFVAFVIFPKSVAIES